MPKASREYVTAQVSTIPVEIFRKNREIVEGLQQVARGRRIGWQVICLRTAEDIENEALEPEEILAASGGRLPVIFVNVTFHTEELSGAELSEWEARFELKLLGEMVARF